MTAMSDVGGSGAPASGPSSSEPVTPLLVLVFVCELAMLAGLAVIGAALGTGWAASIGLAVALPVAAAALWTCYLAPSAARRLRRMPRLALKLVLFVGAGVSLAAVGYPVAGLTFALSSAVSVIAANARSDLA